MVLVYICSPPLRIWCTLWVVLQTSYQLIPSDVYVCHTPSLYLTPPLSFQQVISNHFVLIIYCDSNESSALFWNNNGILPFCKSSGLAYGFLIIIAFIACSCRSLIFMVVFIHQSVYHNSRFPLLYWLSPLNSVTYLRVASIHWAIP